MKEYKASRGALHLIQIALFVLAALLSAAAFSFLGRWELIMWILISVFGGSAFVIGLICLPLFFRNLRCYASESRVSVMAGILFVREQSIRLERVQFVQIVTGPFDGIFGMNFIILHVYGGQLLIPFLLTGDRYEVIAKLERGGVFRAT